MASFAELEGAFRDLEQAEEDLVKLGKRRLDLTNQLQQLNQEIPELRQRRNDAKRRCEILSRDLPDV